MQRARRINIPGAVVTIPIITRDATASWVAETEEKPVSRATVSSKLLTPYKLTVLETLSNEFKRDLPAVYEELVRRLPRSLGLKFNNTVLGNAAPGANFDTLGVAAAVAIHPHATGRNTLPVHAGEACK